MRDFTNHDNLPLSVTLVDKQIDLGLCVECALITVANNRSVERSDLEAAWLRSREANSRQLVLEHI